MRLDVQGLKKSYPGLEVLTGVDLAVAAGEVVAIRGQSGTGKSTLLHCLGLLDRADAGIIRLDGQDLAGLTPAAAAGHRARRIGFVFQAFHLLPEFTVRENIMMSARTAGIADGGPRADDLLARVGLAGRGAQAVTTLSGGERQRVALCRALLPRPALLLADEPTGNLDRHTAGQVYELMLELNAAIGTALVIVTHDLSLAGRMDQIWRLDDGVLTAGAVNA